MTPPPPKIKNPRPSHTNLIPGRARQRSIRYMLEMEYHPRDKGMASYRKTELARQPITT